MTTKHTTDGAGMRERYEKEFWSEHDDNLTPLEFSSKWWLAELSRLNSQILEGVHRENREAGRFGGYVNAQRINEIINQAFNDLRGGEK